MKVSDTGVRLVAAFEGFRSKPYRDAVGVWTIGYGETHGVTAATKPVTRKQALAQLKKRLNRDYGAEVDRLVKPKLSQHEFDALTSFAYNVGTGGLAGSTLLRKLNLLDRKGAAREFLKWDRAGGRVLAGLSRRRRAEKALFLGHMGWFRFYTFGKRNP